MSFNQINVFHREIESLKYILTFHHQCTLGHLAVLPTLSRSDWNLHQLFTLLTTFGPNMVKKIGTFESFSLLLYTNELFLSLLHFGPVKILQIP